MPTRDVDLTGHHDAVFDRLVKLEALRDAARTGFADLDEGRFVDVPSVRLEDFIAGLGHEAETRARKAGI